MIDITWKIFEVLVNFYQGLMMVNFVQKTMDKKETKNEIFPLVIFAAFIGFVITLFNSLTLFEGFTGMIIYWAIVFMYSCLYRKGSILIKLFYSLIPIIVLAIISVLSLNYVSSLNNMDISTIISNTGLPRFILLLLTQFLYFAVLFILAKIFTFGSINFNYHELVMCLLVLVVSTILAFFIHIVSLEGLTEKQRYFVNVSIIVLIIINIIDFTFITLIKTKNAQIEKYKLSKIHSEYLKKYIDDANIQFKTISKIKHDLKNQLLAIYGLLEEKNIDGAKEFIEENIAIVKKLDIIVDTQNEIVNAVVNTKLNAAIALGIDVCCVSTNNFEGISNTDWCNLLSNMLDNAVSACITLPDAIEKRIELIIQNDEDMYTITISNTISGSILNSNPNLHTTKINYNQHGLGTKIIKDIATKYNGTYLFFEDNEMFTCKVILKK